MSALLQTTCTKAVSNFGAKAVSNFGAKETGTRESEGPAQQAENPSDRPVRALHAASGLQRRIVQAGRHAEHLYTHVPGRDAS